MADESGASFIRPPKYLDVNSPMPLSWNNWIQQYDWFAEATLLNKKSERIQVATFMSSIGPDCVNIYNTFNLKSDETKDVKKIRQKFNEYFTPKLNLTFERYTFNKIIQNEGETFDDFVTCAKIQSKKCNFDKLHDSLLVDKIIIGIRNPVVREKLLSEEEVSLDTAIKICRASELTLKQLDEIQENGAVAVSEIAVKNKKTGSKKSNKNKNFDSIPKSEKSEDFDCKRCGTRHGRKSCPAFNVKCHKCKIKGHLEKMCRTKQAHAIETDSEEESYEELSINSIQTIKDDEENWYEKIQVENLEVKMKLDSGAQCNVLPKSIATQLNLKLNQSRTRNLIAFGDSKIKVIGEISVNCQIRNNKTTLTFKIIDEKVTPILGKTACEEHNLIVRVHELNLNEDIFNGLGCLKDYEYDIDLVDNPKFEVYPARKIPHSLRDKVKAEIDNMVKMGVLTKTHGATPVVSPMVIVHKNNKLRVCLDPTDVNKNIVRRYHPLKTMEEISTRLKNSKFFTILDCSRGLWQIKVSPRTIKYLTMATPWGRYSHKRLPFGLASAPEIFQDLMSRTLEGIENCECSMDDILIFTSTKEDNSRITNKVLQKLNEVGLKLNKDKCVFNAEKVKFLGHIISSEGVSADPEKIEAIKNLKIPKNKTELQRLLGMATYLSKFINNLSGITEPLRQLLVKDTEWVWTENQNTAFNELKNAFSSTPVLRFFDTKADVKLQVDASSYSFGAVLLQNDQPVAYASKALTKAQLSYPQIEKEAAAIRYACNKFHDYVYGKKLEIESDHKPLEIIFKKPIQVAPPRLQRILFDVIQYAPKIKYKKGKLLHIADTLSRDCHSTMDPDEEELQVNIVLNITKSARQDFISSTENDPELQELIKVVLNGWPDEEQDVSQLAKSYWKFRDEISYYEGILLKGFKIIVPKDQKIRVLQNIHRGHFGIQKTLNLAREFLFWRGMTKDITDFINHCAICQQMQPRKPKEPLMCKKVPENQFEIVASDIFHLSSTNKDYLLIVDSYSGFFDFKELQNSTSLEVINHLKAWFSVHGIPDILESDNGPQYLSKLFKDFVTTWKIQHQRSSPLYPRSNGLSERYVQIAKNMLKKCAKDKSDVYLALLNYRNAPKDNVLGSPNQRLMSRSTKSLLPMSKQSLKPKIINNEEVNEKLTTSRLKQKHYADRHSKTATKLSVGDNVRLQIDHKKWIGATIEAEAEEPRSFMVRANNGKLYRRNTIHLEKTDAIIPPEKHVLTVPRETTDVRNDASQILPNTVVNPNESATHSNAPDEQENSNHTSSSSQRPQTTRSGRQVKRIKRMNL